MITILVPALLTGLMLGALRYWIGFFVIGHALFAALAATWIAGCLTRSTTSFRPWHGILAAVVLLAGEAVGFGLAQPWFDPLGWLVRVVSGDTVEYLFGIALVGGTVGRNFQMGVGGGFWLLFTLIDLIFFLLFMMIGLNTFVYREGE